jgi:hypothetical protein
LGTLPANVEALSTSRKYSTLLEVAEAIVSHRDLATLFHDLASRLHLVVRFDYLACVLYDAASNTLLRHILETTEPIPTPARPISVEDDPAGVVLQTQNPLIVSNIAEENRWPRFLERKSVWSKQQLLPSAHNGAAAPGTDGLRLHARSTRVHPHAGQRPAGDYGSVAGLSLARAHDCGDEEGR